jgi:hypothetical protein
MPKRGDVREDGRIFWGNHGDGEDWRTPEKYHKQTSNRTERNRRLKAIRGRWLSLYKKAKGCAICGYKDNPLALQFDHVDPSLKSGNVSNMLAYSLKKLIAEVRKCRVLCANCHMIFTLEKVRERINIRHRNNAR